MTICKSPGLYGARLMSGVRLLLLPCVFLLACPALLLSAELSGVVRNESGRGLANITVTLITTGDTKTEFTDAFGRYHFTNLPGADYMIGYEDQNFIRYTDEDPYPDEGSVYLAYARPDVVTLLEDQVSNLGDVILQQADSTDNRQARLSVTDCIDYGSVETTQTLAYALANAREINIECTGVLKVPELVIQKDVTINAANGVTLEGAGSHRILRVLPGVSLELRGADITGGNINIGSGIHNSGVTTIADAEVTGNRGDTAVIMNFGELNLQQVRLYRNVINYDSVFRNSGVITGRDVTIESHVSSAGPVMTNYGNVEFDRCSISGLATNNVFSIVNNAGSQFKLFNCTLTNSNSPFLNNGTLEIYDSSLDDNDGDQALIENSGVLKVGGTSVTNNEVYSAILYNDGSAEILNSTISANSAGVGVFGNASNVEDFRGVVSNEGLMRIYSSTIAGNQHLGHTNRQIGNAGELRLSNTIVQGTDNGEEACGGASPVISGGHNLLSDGSCGGAVQSDIPYGHSGLLALGDNGGSGKTHALAPGSDAIDAGNCNDGTLSKDQRGVARAQGSGCDIGAYELEQAAGNEDSAVSDDDTDAHDDAEGDHNDANDQADTTDADDNANSTNADDHQSAADDNESASEGTQTPINNDAGETGPDANASASASASASGSGAFGVGLFQFGLWWVLFLRNRVWWCRLSARARRRKAAG